MQIYHFDTLTSTQDLAKTYIAEGRDKPFAILADMQSNGRGRSGNQWISQTGNLLTSIVIPLNNIPAQHAGQYSFLTAVALMDCLSDYGVTMAQNKWPNDILVNHQKIAGILLESDINASGLLTALIIGVGVNLASAPEGAASLKTLTGDTLPPIEFLKQFIKHLNSQLLYMQQSGFTAIRTRWLENAYGLGTVIKIRLPHETFFGEFLGLDDDGALLVNVDGVPRKVYSGEVFFKD